ncbi:MAG: sulfur carrier protein ThiS [Acidobacteria bacterium]|nr:sulfur carrier protein ThiS [Acidobacteriota bacterium]MCI0628151.1 sulfur carrier protein ThiS [Acidobacteriota bacterium]
MAIEILLNGERKDVPDGQNILDLVRSLGLPAERLAVEHNLQIVKRDHWNQKLLRHGDKVEIVQFVGGGSAGSS